MFHNPRGNCYTIYKTHRNVKNTWSFLQVWLLYDFVATAGCTDISNHKVIAVGFISNKLYFVHVTLEKEEMPTLPKYIIF